MRVEYAELSLQGGRDSNQDRVSVAVAEEAALLIACDGMGGHAEGERAAEIAQQTRGRALLAGDTTPARSARVSAPGAGGRARQRGRAGAAPADRAATARHLRGVRGTADLGLLGAYRRQPRVPPAGRAGARTNARSQSCRAADARGRHQRRSDAESPDAQLRRVMPRRGIDIAGDGVEPTPVAAAGRSAAGVYRWLLGQSG